MTKSSRMQSKVCNSIHGWIKINSACSFSFFERTIHNKLQQTILTQQIMFDLQVLKKSTTLPGARKLTLIATALLLMLNAPRKVMVFRQTITPHKMKNSPANWHSFLAYKTASGFHFFASIADAKHIKKTLRDMASA